MDVTEECVESYRRLRSLKCVGAEIGIPWQTVYVHLRKAGEPVTGDKLHYGSDTDRLAARAEQYFADLVPFAKDMNLTKFQAKYDALVHGHRVDIKAARLLRGSWAFSLKKQQRIADFFVAFAYNEEGEQPLHVLLFPGDCVRHYSTIRAVEGNRWWSYRLSESELTSFMDQLRDIKPQEAA